MLVASLVALSPLYCRQYHSTKQHPSLHQHGAGLGPSKTLPAAAYQHPLNQSESRDMWAEGLATFLCLQCINWCLSLFMQVLSPFRPSPSQGVIQKRNVKMFRDPAPPVKVQHFSLCVVVRICLACRSENGRTVVLYWLIVEPFPFSWPSFL